MAKQANPSPQPQPPATTPPRKPSWLLYLIGAIVLLFLLQKIGCGPVRTEEKMEWIDR